MKFKNVVKHFKLITYHKWLVFKLCCKIGQPWRGLVHDLSKYSWTEFWESANHYVGTYSPIKETRKDIGYSNAWLHHKGRNKHHVEYWVDENSPIKATIMPYPYAAEMICDKLAAGMAYQGKNFTPQYELEYWQRERTKQKIHPKIEQFVTDVLTEMAKEGLDKTLTKKNIKSIYDKNVNGT